MNREELISELNFFTNNHEVISTVLFFLLKVGEEFVIKKVDIENSLQTRLTKQFREYITEKFTQNYDLSYIPLSEQDDKKNVAFRYDFEEVIGNLACLDIVLANQNQTNFNAANDKIENLFGYITVSGNENKKLVTFRKHHPIDFVNRERRLYIFPSNQRFVEMQNDGFIIDKGFDFIKVNGDLVVIKPNTLEHYFGFSDVIKTHSETAIQTIQNLNFLANPVDFRQYAQSDVSFQRKLVKTKNSPVLAIPFNKVSEFVSNHPKLKSIIKTNPENTAFELASTNSKKLFLSLLNDDYLHSGLTATDYTAKSKDKLE